MYVFDLTMSYQDIRLVGFSKNHKNTHSFSSTFVYKHPMSHLSISSVT